MEKDEVSTVQLAVCHHLSIDRGNPSFRPQELISMGITTSDVGCSTCSNGGDEEDFEDWLFVAVRKAQERRETATYLEYYIPWRDAMILYC